MSDRPIFTNHEHEWVEHSASTAAGTPVAVCACGLYKTTPATSTDATIGPVSDLAGVVRAFRRSTAGTSDNAPEDSR